ncbi:MAG: hypothetical protein KF871_02865 [Hydrogenophaga sp.]|nr:hypothetical protein [Hydrogenophaga sp.]
MDAIADFLGQLGRTVLRLALALAAAVFLMSLLVASLVVVAGVSLWSLVTGRKPAPMVLFGRMRERSRQASQGVWRGQAGTARQADVVDVEAREVDDDRSGRQS